MTVDTKPRTKLEERLAKLIYDLTHEENFESVVLSGQEPALNLAHAWLGELQAALREDLADATTDDPVGLYVKAAAIAQQMVDLGLCLEGPKLTEAKTMFREVLAALEGK